MRRAARPLLYAGILAVVFGLAKVHAAFIGHYDLTGSARFAWTIAYAAILSITAYGFGLPDLPRSRQAALGASVGAAAVGALLISAIQLVVGDALLPRFVVVGSAILLPDWYRVCVGLAAGGRSRGEARDRVLVVADPDEVADLAAELSGSPERPASIVAEIEAGQATSATPGTGPVERLAASVSPTVVVLGRAALDDASIVAQAATLHARGVRIRSMSLFYEEWLGKLPVAELERAAMLFDIGEVHRAGFGRAKRIFDLPFALAGLGLLVVLLPCVLVGNMVANRGPLFYRQDRVGKGGRVFTILKLRTMTPREDTSTPREWTTEGDARVTRFGRVLRRMHLDELPQVLNILKGDISVVGPRPEQPHYVEMLEEKIPFYGLRHLVRPGLTGWAQVKLGYAGDEREARQKLQYEAWYLRHENLRLDLRIIGRTIRSVFGTQGRGR